ncbi:hypothetical protein UC35_14920 [Ramlibacter tataouinensis]|uniref:Uncharacterized protein n=1 Tax=Ramlibacter tataouinensis TaxID=94132 RepID=A0A127JV74_9BURK|nr:hypothetical protein UC35_14920 [Ramlibacter tataouinensis]
MASFTGCHETHGNQWAGAAFMRALRLLAFLLQFGLPHCYASAFFAEHGTRKAPDKQARVPFPRCLEHLLESVGESTQLDDAELLLLPSVETGDDE